MNKFNEALEQEKQNVLRNENLNYKIRLTAWNKVYNEKVVHVRDKNIDRAIELTRALPMLTKYDEYKENIVKSITTDENKEVELANFMVQSSADELKFFLAQMMEDSGTSWFVNDYCFERPILRQAINEMMQRGQVEKVRVMYAFAFDDIMELRLSGRTHPNSFPAYAECICGGEVAQFLDSFLNQNALIFNDFLVNVQSDCLDYKQDSEFLHDIATYNDVKRFDFDNQINDPAILFKSYVIFKYLNEKKVKEGDKMSVNEFVERDKIRESYDDFNAQPKSEVAKLFEDNITK